MTDFLAQQIERVKRLRAARAANGDRAAKRLLLRQWQAARLARTHADLLKDANSRPAAQFFLDELYGPRDADTRDASVERIYPVMQKMLPEAAPQVIAKAVELDALSEELDARLLDVLIEQLALGDKITEAAYAEAYRRCDNRALRKHQIELVTEVGSALVRIVTKPLIGKTLRTMRLPARLAGFGELQQFLESGFSAYSQLRDPQAFLAAIEGRETLILERIFAGDPKPFNLP